MARTRAGVDGAVFQAADGLVEALQHTPEWEEWENAKAAFDRDEELKKLRQRLEELTGRWRQAQGMGKGLTGGEATELAGLQEKLHTHALFQRQQDAGRQLVALFQQANDLISNLLGIDFAANAVRRGGGCCG
jgi:cell fate (sporulation/competence/biofilm development) regulator YlbF (YheA/YmcA/DUF963 family)